MAENKLITPRKLQGFWELMPSDQIIFSSLLEKIENVFKQNCFVPLDTPVLEYSEALLAKSGGETDKQVFRFTKGDNDMCMRYDLTVPLARFVAMHENELTFPFKRYQIGKVYRGERPQKGRFREFYQCDADIIGNGELSLVADAECVKLFEKCFKALDLDVEIKLSNRKLLSGIMEEIDSSNEDILIILDKVDKIGKEAAIEELKNLGLDDKNCEKIINLTQICGKIDQILPKIKNYSQNELYQTGVKELEEVCMYLKAMGLDCTCDLSVIRGHNYYTGTVFEGFLAGKNIAVGGGGRFENLCSYFSNKKMPGVGMSVGITRLFDVLKADGYFDSQKQSETDVLLVNFDETLMGSLSLMNALREKGVKADILSEYKSFKSKMKEANRRGVKYVIIVGQDELDSGKFALKNMTNGQQQNLSVEEIVDCIKNDRM